MNGSGGTLDAWFMVERGKPFEKRRIPLPSPPQGEVLVEVAGCGVCHTDISFLHLGVKTRAELPLVLGHEISGIVREAGEGVDPDLVGRPVLVPAVLPCGICDLCRAGHRRICSRQIMPGNDRNGGFATHVLVPARYVCPIGANVLRTTDLWELAIVADAVTTPFQAVRRSGLAAGELAIFIGVGGIGVHGVQIAHAAGARVIALDIHAHKLETARSAGADAAIDVTGLDTKAIRVRIKEETGRIGVPGVLWKIFETSGTRAGQETAFNLLGQGATLSIVGFTMDKLEVRLSNLMAFDATLHGNWGCDPVLYPEVLSWIADGRIRVRPFVEKHPLDDINAVFEAAHHGELERRAVLTPGKM
jgi:6-hydroxycyclohex-1-ene-1-carbonyl-CoA dehydrogenase